jgi:hypothetical protein
MQLFSPCVLFQRIIEPFVALFCADSALAVRDLEAALQTTRISGVVQATRCTTQNRPHYRTSVE